MAGRPLEDHEYIFVVKVELKSNYHQGDPEAEARWLTPIHVQRTLEGHILDAVHSWGGQNYSDDIRHTMNIHKVIVQPVRKPKS